MFTDPTKEEKLEQDAPSHLPHIAPQHSPLLKFTPTISSAPVSSHTENFLSLVVSGQEEDAEKMLIADRNLALQKINITDLSGRTFKEITGFQYALWALDTHMWQMMMRYLPKDAAGVQIRESVEGSWVKEHGIHAKPIFDNLIAAYSEVHRLLGYDSYKANKVWIARVGGAQQLLPMHAIQEYCDPTAKVYSPYFDLRSSLYRSSNVGVGPGSGTWFSSIFDAKSKTNEILGTHFALARRDVHQTLYTCDNWTAVHRFKNMGDPAIVATASWFFKELSDERMGQRTALIKVLAPEDTDDKAKKVNSAKP